MYNNCYYYAMHYINFGFTMSGYRCSTSLPVDILQLDTVKVPPTSHHYHEEYWYEKNAMLDLQY